MAPSQYKLGEVLPMQAPKYPPITEIDYRKVPPPPRFEVKPPARRPMSSWF
jgi:arylsulfatase